jgi:ELWxxDGT repeat protein
MQCPTLNGLPWLAAVAASFGLLAGAARAAGQAAYLVDDLAPGFSGPTLPDPSSLLAVGNRVFFIAGASNEFLGGPWVTDGTAAGTQMLPDACLYGRCPSPPAFVAAIGQVAFFVESPISGSTGQELWRTDGTRAGTYPLLGATDLGGFGSFVTLNGALYFVFASFSGPGPQLWRSDGTLPGTSPVTAAAGQLTATTGRLFFVEGDAAGHPTELWTSDGTAAGTTEISTPRNISFLQLIAAGSRVFLFAEAANSQAAQLWVSDGTSAGTRPASSQAFTGLFGAVFAVGNNLYFEADDGTHGTQLWTSDGTPAGTLQVGSGAAVVSVDGLATAAGRIVFATNTAPGVEQFSAISAASPGGPVANLCPDGCGTVTAQRFLVSLGSHAVFATSVHGEFDLDTLWSTDGTRAGTLLLKHCGGECVPAVANGAVFFAVTGADGEQLWRTDGTPEGTRRFAAVPLSFDRPLALAGFPGQVFFVAPLAATDPSSPLELFVSDGTAAGVHQLTGGSGPLSSSPANLVAAGSELYFGAASSSSGVTLWHSAGTAASTLPVAVSPAPGTPAPVAAFGGVVFQQFVGASLQLWRSDGTVAGTQALTGFSAPLSVAASCRPLAGGGFVYFAVTNQGGGGAIWRSDGTRQGSAELFALPATTLGVERLALANGDFYLVLDNAQGGVDVWRSDGTAGGTLPLTDLGRQEEAADQDFVVFRNVVYFLLIDRAEVRELWQTDGTMAGTAPVPFVDRGSASVFDLVATGGSLYYFSFAAIGGSSSLMRSDGTVAGTVELGSFVGSPGGITPFSNGIAFSADDGSHGDELWWSDGTPGGTRLVSDIWTGPAGSNPSSLIVADGRLFFAANDGIHGTELWESDGTAAGTRLAQDINPGPDSSNPQDLTLAGGLLYFSADDGLAGQELWALPLGAASGCQPSATALCLTGNRFRVEALWQDSRGDSGVGQTLNLTSDTGTFWFFSPDNIEVILKVIDGRALNDSFWVFYGALSNVQYWLTVTDTQNGLTRRYFNPLDQLASVGDTAAFGPMGATSIGDPAAAPATRVGVATTSAAPCRAGPLRLCLDGGRFAVEASWADFSGNTGTGKAVSLTDATGYFWFFAASNVETVLKVLDGRAVNGHFWLFYGALSDVQYTLTVTDTSTGAVRTYTNPAGQFASVADTTAF